MRLLSRWLLTLASWLSSTEPDRFSCAFGCDGKLTREPEKSLYRCVACDRRWVRDEATPPTFSLISPQESEQAYTTTCGACGDSILTTIPLALGGRSICGACLDGKQSSPE